MRKKQVRILLAVFLLCLCLFSSCSDLQPQLRQTDFSATELLYENQERYYYDRLTPNGKIAYTRIINEIQSHPEQIEIPQLSDAEFEAVFYAVSYDNPQLLCFGKTSEVRSSGSRYYYIPAYAAGVAECTQQTQALEARVSSFLQTVPAGSTDYEKELAAHDFICAGCTYMYDENDTSLKASAYDALVFGGAVCEGYARAAKLLLDRLGIRNYLITGNATNTENVTESHMWNIVTLAGKNYHLDLTWDDIDTSGDRISHTYFNVTDEVISTNHSDFSPQNNNCVSRDMNFYAVNGTLFDAHASKNSNAIVKNAVRNIRSGENGAELAYTNTAAFEAAINDYVQQSEIYLLLEEINHQASTRFDTVIYTQDDNMRVIRFDFE